MTEAEESAYMHGQRAAWRAMLGTCLGHLGIDDPAAGKARWVAEREDAIAQLRELCGEFGDNDWDEPLHLADVIEKHLGKHLWANAEEDDTP